LEQKGDWKLNKEIAQLTEEIESVKNLVAEAGEIEELEKLGDESLTKEIEAKKAGLLKSVEEQEIKTYLAGIYDRNDAIIEVWAGAGGVDAEDWTTMLLRMYQRYCQDQFATKVISQSFGEGGGPEGRIGTKSVALEIKGPYAYGILKRESGTHRLVRQSPFSAKKTRHTSFATVEVLPILENKEMTEIKEEDIRIDLFRSSGPGGQNVNKRETAVRLTHLPTNLVASSQSERSQASNREKAMSILNAKIFKKKEEEKKKEMKTIRGEGTGNSWGTQIRSYVLHPYKLVKDNRTGVESSDPENVLDGNLKDFIEAQIKTQ